MASPPTAPPVPSRTDRELNYWPNVVHVIVSLTSDPPTVGAWWLNDRDLKTFAKGPTSLAKAYNENPPSYPGPS